SPPKPLQPWPGCSWRRGGGASALPAARQRSARAACCSRWAPAGRRRESGGGRSVEWARRQSWVWRGARVSLVPKTSVSSPCNSSLYFVKVPCRKPLYGIWLMSRCVIAMGCCASDSANTLKIFSHLGMRRNKRRSSSLVADPGSGTISARIGPQMQHNIHFCAILGAVGSKAGEMKLRAGQAFHDQWSIFADAVGKLGRGCCALLRFQPVEVRALHKVRGAEQHIGFVVQQPRCPGLLGLSGCTSFSPVPEAVVPGGALGMLIEASH